jgi:hypothetical protein
MPQFDPAGLRADTMRRLRWPFLLAIVILSALLGYFLRDVVYQVVIVPLAYLLWVVSFYYSAIPQWVVWTVLLVFLFLSVAWNLIPDERPSNRKVRLIHRPEGEVEALAVWIRKSRRGNYFKWQLANRMGRVARRLDELAGSRGLPACEDPRVEKYLDAGLNYSFVDFPTPRGWFERASQTPLDIDPRTAADYLESLMEKTSGRRG